MDERAGRELIRRISNAARSLTKANEVYGEPSFAQNVDPVTAQGNQSPDVDEVASRSRPPNELTTALISWAHRNPGWDDDTADGWRDSVLEFAAMLRSPGGIDADIDLYHSDDLVVDWTRFGPKRIEETDFTLVVISKAWSDRWFGRNSPSVGAGAVGEADQLKGMFQSNQEKFQERTKLILLPGVADSEIPSDLSRLSRYRVDPADFATLEPLLRALTGQPSVAIPTLSDVPVLPPSISAKTSVTAKNKPRRNSETENLLTELRVLRRRRSQLEHANHAGHADTISRLDDEIAVLESLADSLYNSDDH